MLHLAQRDLVGAPGAELLVEEVDLGTFVVSLGASCKHAPHPRVNIGAAVLLGRIVEYIGNAFDAPESRRAARTAY